MNFCILHPLYSTQSFGHFLQCKILILRCIFTWQKISQRLCLDFLNHLFLWMVRDISGKSIPDFCRVVTGRTSVNIMEVHLPKFCKQSIYYCWCRHDLVDLFADYIHAVQISLYICKVTLKQGNFSPRK